MLKQQFVLKREQVSAAFENVYKFPLTIAVAAMGFGKTTAALGYLNSVAANYLWVSVEGNETSPQYLWDSLASQISKRHPDLGNQLRMLGFPMDTSQRDAIVKIIEDLTFNTDTILVIDDYQCVKSIEFNGFIEKIVKSQIDGFHILLLSKTVPEMHVDELLLKSFCYFIKSELFEFNKSDIKTYFELYGLVISEDVAQRVYEFSEGWISAIYLMMKRYSETGGLETGRSIERMIDTAVMSRYSDREITTLKALCVLDSFTPNQAVYVTNEKTTARVMKKLSFGNSFIRYDEREDVYRIHNIFKNYLIQQFEETTSEVNMAQIFLRSGEWCIQNGDLLSGLKYYLKAKAFDHILVEFEKSRMISVIDSNPKYVLELFEQIPMAVKYQHPIGYISYIGFYVTNVDQQKGARLLDEMECFCRSNQRLTSVQKRRISGEIELIRSYIEFNDVRKMHKKLLKAHEMLDGRSSIANRDKIVTFGSPHILYLYFRDQGKMLWTVEYLENMFRYYMEMANGCGVGFEAQLRAEYYLETGNFAEAALNAYKSIYKARTLDQVSVILCSNFTLARLNMAQGKFNEAYDLMDDLTSKVEASNSPILNSALALCLGYLGGIRSDERSFSTWLKSGEVAQSDVLYHGMGFNYIVLGKYLLLQKEFIKLEVICEEMMQVFSKFNNQLGYLHAYLLESVSKLSLYGMESAYGPMLSAIELGRESQIVLPFAEYGEYILEIIKSLRNITKNDKYLEKLVVCSTDYALNLVEVKIEGVQIPIFKGREKEILELVVAGKTNRVIATELFIAEITVRKNITSIYRKLGVNGRASAVKMALQLKVI